MNSPPCSRWYLYFMMYVPSKSKPKRHRRRSETPRQASDTSIPLGLQVPEVFVSGVDVGDRIERREVQANVGVAAILAGSWAGGKLAAAHEPRCVLRRIAEDRLLGHPADLVLDLDVPVVHAERTAAGSAR